MKLQLDTNSKTIKIEGTVRLEELFSKLKTILPDWESYSLESNTVIQYWTNPIYVPTYRDPYPWIKPSTPYYTNRTTCNGPLTNTVTSTYNVEF